MPVNIYEAYEVQPEVSAAESRTAYSSGIHEKERQRPEQLLQGSTEKVLQYQRLLEDRYNQRDLLLPGSRGAPTAAMGAKPAPPSPASATSNSKHGKGKKQPTIVSTTTTGKSFSSKRHVRTHPSPAGDSTAAQQTRLSAPSEPPPAVEQYIFHDRHARLPEGKPPASSRHGVGSAPPPPPSKPPTKPRVSLGATLLQSTLGKEPGYHLSSSEYSKLIYSHNLRPRGTAGGGSGAAGISNPPLLDMQKYLAASTPPPATALKEHSYYQQAADFVRRAASPGRATRGEQPIRYHSMEGGTTVSSSYFWVAKKGHAAAAVAPASSEWGEMSAVATALLLALVIWAILGRNGGSSGRRKEDGSGRRKLGQSVALTPSAVIRSAVSGLLDCIYLLEDTLMTSGRVESSPTASGKAGHKGKRFPDCRGRGSPGKRRQSGYHVQESLHSIASSVHGQMTGPQESLGNTVLWARTAAGVRWLVCCLKELQARQGTRNGVQDLTDNGASACKHILPAGTHGVIETRSSRAMQEVGKAKRRVGKKRIKHAIANGIGKHCNDSEDQRMDGVRTLGTRHNKANRHDDADIASTRKPRGKSFPPEHDRRLERKAANMNTRQQEDDTPSLCTMATNHKKGDKDRPAENKPESRKQAVATNDYCKLSSSAAETRKTYTPKNKGEAHTLLVGQAEELQEESTNFQLVVSKGKRRAQNSSGTSIGGHASVQAMGPPNVGSTSHVLVGVRTSEAINVSKEHKDKLVAKVSHIPSPELETIESTPDSEAKEFTEEPSAKPTGERSTMPSSIEGNLELKRKVDLTFKPLAALLDEVAFGRTPRPRSYNAGKKKLTETSTGSKKHSNIHNIHDNNHNGYVRQQHTVPKVVNEEGKGHRRSRSHSQIDLNLEPINYHKSATSNGTPRGFGSTCIFTPHICPCLTSSNQSHSAIGRNSRSCEDLIDVKEGMKSETPARPFSLKPSPFCKCGLFASGRNRSWVPSPGASTSQQLHSAHGWWIEDEQPWVQAQGKSSRSDGRRSGSHKRR